VKAAIEVCGVSKKYFRGVLHSRGRITDALMQWSSDLLRHGSKKNRAKQDLEPFWALKDVSLTVEHGQVVGIVGRNGSGKSTLLKIIAQITAPTIGEVRISGRTGTLLEVGTGFHPELSGRENIFLNGAILGMKRAEIIRKFDEIVDFSGVGEFIDTPVKRYSSGMQTRLAFSVAAHLDPEILIVDEVLAVGDAEFQKKCLGKMSEVSKAGRTVLFVSHNINAVDQLCNRVILLDRGQLVADSTDKAAVISRYLFGETNATIKGEIDSSDVVFRDNEFFAFKRMRLCDANGRTIDGPIASSVDVFVEIRLEIKKLRQELTFGYAVLNEEGSTVYWTFTTDSNDFFFNDLQIGDVVLSTRIPPRFLNQGIYRIEFMAGIHKAAWLVEAGEQQRAVLLHIEGGMSDSIFWQHHRVGVVAPVLPWRVQLPSTDAAVKTDPGAMVFSAAP
jgi:lipopolysaccharide transport system ATP-binding protein